MKSGDIDKRISGGKTKNSKFVIVNVKKAIERRFFLVISSGNQSKIDAKRASE